MQDAINSNQQQLAEQQAELEHLSMEVQALKAAQVNQPWQTNPTPMNSCNKPLMRIATQKGGEQFAAGDFGRALGYYQDAVMACPSSAQAQLNVARAYETIGERKQALEHYRVAASQTGPNADPASVSQAREALQRLSASK